MSDEPEQLDLLQWQPPAYPDAPGWKARDTSRIAAADVAPAAETHLALILGWFEYGHVGTADEAGAAFDLQPLQARPRVSQLSKLGLIKDTGHRAASAFGSPAIVWSKP